MPIISTTKMTAKQFLRLGEDPPGVRLELVNGEIAVSPSPIPRHSYAVIQIVVILEVHNQAHELGELHQDVDTILDDFTVRRPDVLFYFKDRTHLISDKALNGVPDLAVEVISPGSVEIDRADKFAEYRRAGIRFYWIIDPELRTTEAWELKRGRYVRAGRGKHSDVVSLPPFPDLDIPLERLWRKSTVADVI